jgi:hypothetical protein
MEPDALIAFGRGRSGPAGLNAAAVNALKDPTVRKQLENLGLQMPPRTSSRRSARAGGRLKLQNGGDDQGRKRQVGLAA